MYQLKKDIIHVVDKTQTLLIVSVLDSSDCYFKATGLTKDVFLGIKEGKSVETIVSELVDAYDTTEATVRADVAKLISYLIENQILEEK